MTRKQVQKMHLDYLRHDFMSAWAWLTKVEFDYAEMEGRDCEKHWYEQRYVQHAEMLSVQMFG